MIDNHSKCPVLKYKLRLGVCWAPHHDLVIYEIPLDESASKLDVNPIFFVISRLRETWRLIRVEVEDFEAHIHI